MNPNNAIAPLPVNEWAFVDELKKPEFTSWSWARRAPEPQEVDLSNGVNIQLYFPDPENLLESAIADFEHFLKLGKVKIKSKSGFPIIIRPGNFAEKETYRITVTSTEVCLGSGDIEGIRRALYYLIDEMLIADGPFLKCQRIKRRPFIKSRISRCFFGPLKRPPFYCDELMDNIDYYPKAYLSRLAHEGTNGLWLTIDFKTLAQTKIMPVDPYAEQRLDKLRRVVNSCRRYGIKIYLYCCEPVSFDENDPILKKFPELSGTVISGKRGFCPNSATAQEYLRQALFSIFSAVPHLGGMILLSVGEWHTLCCNFPGHSCPNCGDKPPWKALALSLSAMEKGMHQANPKAELISWPYTQIYYWGREKAVEAAAHVPVNVKLMHNFESNGSKMQLGKMRTVSDYWLSYIGPSSFFKACARNAANSGTSMFAKLQVSCSWECATTQYVPVPANLYAKYRAMLNLGISGVMQCWYFGSYPSLMTKAAGLLSFRPFPANHMKFLERLAQLSWPRELAPQVVKAWKLFSKAYDNYPLSNNLGYIGPVHDSVVWYLHLKPVNRRLTPSWQTTFPAPGDRIGEAISSHKNYDEAFSMCEIIRLTDKMLKFWDAGLNIMRSLPLRSNANRRELGIAEAVRILIAGTNAIFRFYSLREKMIFAKVDKPRLSMLEKLRKIVEEQICLSRRMLPLIAADPAIGFHSEAEGYKFTPAMIKERIAWLKTILRRDFPAAEKRIRANRSLYPEYTGESPVGKVGKIGETIRLHCYGRLHQTYYGAYSNFNFIPIENANPPISTFQADFDDEFLYFTLYAEKPMPNDRFIIHLEAFRLTWSELITIHRDGSSSWWARRAVPLVKTEETENAWTAQVKISKTDIGMDKKAPRPFRINIERTFRNGKQENTLCWVELHPLKHIFVLGHYNPDDFGWLIPK